MKKNYQCYLFIILMLIGHSIYSQTEYEFPGTWSDNFARTGTPSSKVYAVAEDASGHIWIAQSPFDNNNNPTQDRLIRFDGRNWNNEDPGFNADVDHIAFDSQGQLYAAGDFTEIDGQTYNHIAVWDGNSWQPLGQGITKTFAFRDITIFSLFIDENDNVYIGGEFENAGGEASVNIAMWDGNSWKSFGEHLDYRDPVLDIAKVENELWLAVPGTSSSTPYGIKRYDLDTNGWLENLPSSPSYDGSSITSINYDGNDRVYISGQDTSNNDDLAFGYFSLPDFTITALDIPSDYLADVTFHRIADDGSIYLMGFFDGFQRTEDFNSKTVMRWTVQDGFQALPDVEGYRMSTSPNTPKYPEINDGIISSQNELFLVGRIGLAGEKMAYNITKWEGSEWKSLGNGLGTSITTPIANGRVYHISSNSQDEIMVAGSSIFGGNLFGNVAKWNKTTENWSPIGNGLGNNVYHITEDPQGNLYAGGTFTNVSYDSNTLSFNRVTQLIDGEWQPMAEGLSAEVNVIYTDDDYIIAGGGFASPFGVAIWNKNSETWEAIQGTGTTVYDILKGPDGKIYFGGRFRFVQGEEEFFNIAAWDGNAFYPVGNGISGTIYDLQFLPNGNLIAGGSFSTNTINGRLNRIAELKSDGNWHPIGDGFDDNVLALEVSKEGALVAGGEFTASGDKTINYLAAWNGNAWTGFENGINNLVRSLHLDKDGYIWIGGDFSMAGGKTAQGVTYWDGDLPAPQEAFLLVEILGEGSISPNYDSNASFEIGEQITVEALPDEGYVFDKFVIDDQEFTDNPIDITMDSTVSLLVIFEEGGNLSTANSELDQVSIYPNPFIDSIQINGEFNSSINYEIFTSNGQLIQNGKVENQNIPLEHFQHGFYVLKLETESSQKIIKIVKE